MNIEIKSTREGCKEDFPVLIRGTNLNEILHIFKKERFPYSQKLIHAYVVKEGFLERGIFCDVPINPKNNFTYVRNAALPWAAWLDRNERYITGMDAKLFSEDETGGYLIYFNERALDSIVCQDLFDIPEVLSAVVLDFKKMGSNCVKEITPLLREGGKCIK